jgi:monoamine oxidase
MSKVQQMAAEVATGTAAEAPGTTRREALKRAGAATAGVALARPWLPVAQAATAPRIVVVGGGLAGLTATYRLKQAGYAAQLYEASDRTGGRCWTIRGAFADGQIAEHGGELIDTGHTELRQLVQELGLDTDNLSQAEPNGSEDAFYFDGRAYPVDQATTDLKGIWQQIHADVSAASYPTLYNSSTQRGRELDNMSIAQYIDAEYGAETNVQSALNMLYLLAYSGQGNLRIFGPSNEKFHVRGGNDQVPSLLTQALGSQVNLGSELIAIKRNADGSYALTFKQGSRSKTVTADQVVLALPFSIMRASVDWSQAGFNTYKQRAIRELGMGTNSKLHVQFTDRHWYGLNCNGETYADTGYQNTWEVTRAQSGRSGILVDYTGGTIGASFGSGTPVSRAQQFLTQIEPVLPGISAKFNGRATIDFWTAYPWTKGSYSYWKVGQYQAFAGAEGERSGNCHFAGEHTSIDFQGYLNGGVESGERAASEILADLK